MSIDNELLEDSETLEDTEDNTEVEQSDEDTGEEETGESSEPDYKALYEKEKSMRQGLVKKLQVSKVKSQPKEVSQPTFSEERLDKLELRQIDPDLTAEQIQEIILIKKAKGLTDVTKAYDNPMVQSWLTSARSESEHKDRVKKAIPKAQGKSVISEPQRTSLKHNNNWLKNMPKESTEDVAKIIEDTFFGNK